MSPSLLLMGVLAAPILNALQSQWLRSIAARQALLLAMSLAIGFAYCGLWIGALGIAAAGVWMLAAVLHRSAQEKRQSWLVWPAVAIGIAALAGARSEAFVTWWSQIQASVLKHPPIVMLVGTSYFLLRALSLLFDARKGKLKEAPSLATTLNYLLFFPTLISGPIDRYGRFRQELIAPKAVDGPAVDAALWRGVVGLFKKIVIVNTLMPYAMTAQISDMASLTTVQAWSGFYIWAIVIYLDFSGYCDIAISLGRLLGFTVPENFRWPYLTRNITAFWRRWHISLSEWLRDYAFLPSGMAFSRAFKGRSLLAGCLAALLTFAICGVWHGFEIHFLVWGLMHGVWVFGHKLYQDATRTTLPKAFVAFTRDNPLGHAICVLLTFHGVALTWVFFGAPDLATAAAFLRVMAGDGA